MIIRRHCTSIPTPANLINEIEYQEKKDNMPFGITFKPKIAQHNIWLAGVDINEEIDEDEAEDEEDQQLYEEINTNKETAMDINNIHDINHEPYEFHVPNHKHIPNTIHQQDQITHINTDKYSNNQNYTEQSKRLRKRNTKYDNYYQLHNFQKKHMT